MSGTVSAEVPPWDLQVIRSADGSILAAAAGTPDPGRPGRASTSQNGAIRVDRGCRSPSMSGPGDVAQRSLQVGRQRHRGSVSVPGAITRAGTCWRHLSSPRAVTLKLVAGRAASSDNKSGGEHRTRHGPNSAYWDSLRLRASTSAERREAGQAVKSFEDGRTQDYALYWQIRQRQTDPATHVRHSLRTRSRRARRLRWSLPARPMPTSRRSGRTGTAQYRQLNAECRRMPPLRTQPASVRPPMRRRRRC